MSRFSQLTNAKHFKRHVVIAFFTISLVVWAGFFIYGRHYLSTDDAYLNANVIQIATRINGKINHVYVKNNAYVHQGDLLFEVDPDVYAVAFDSAKAQLVQCQAKLEQIITTAKRTLPLVRKHVLPPQSEDNISAELKAAQAELAFAKARLKQTELNLAYTRVIAAVSGWVTNLTLQVGDIVAANQPLFALISEEEFWTDANFKETEIARIKPGQSARIAIDMYPGQYFDGVVDSISGGAGAAFSLLPPQNASGNWVKVTQRIPVKVRIVNPNHTKYPLRIGASATVTVTLQG